MRILHISKFYPPVPGGIEYFVFDAVEHLSKYIPCDVLSFNTNNTTVIDKMKNYTVTRASILGTLCSCPISSSLCRLLKEIHHKYDLIHLHLPNPMANLVYYLVQPKTKLILHWHSDILKQKTLLQLYKPLQNWLLERADLIIATSQKYLEGSVYLQRYKHKCKVIPLGLNPERLQVSEQKSIEIKKEFGQKPIIFTIGRLAYYKGLNYLIEAMKYIDANLLIGGAGYLQQDLEMKIKQSNLSDKVFLLGKIPQEHLGSFYKTCDVFTLPSIYKTEAFGLVQIEAMYFGKPIVSTDIPDSGVSWVNQDNHTGLLVPPKNLRILANALNKMINDSDLKKRAGKNSRERFNNEFLINRVADKIADTYELLLEDKV